MRVTAGIATDIGQARERNEDAYLAEAPLYAVADGMGGHRAGDVASSLALEILQRIADDGTWDRLADQVKEANRVVFERSAGEQELSGMGTTLTAAVAGDRDVRLVHVGDSRAYLLRDGDLRQLTEDHTLVQRMVQEGKISRDEAGIHPQRSILTRALGVDEEVPVDEMSIEVRDGDRLLLCTDGLTGMIREESIVEILSNSPDDPQRAAEELVDAANRAGGLDNITVVLLDFAVEEGGSGEADGGSSGAERGSRVAAAPATEDIPEAASSVQPAGEPDTGFVPVVPDGEGDAEGSVDFRPADARWAAGQRKSRIRIAAWIVVPLLVLVAAWFGLQLYLDRQWYVGVADGNVAIYNGIPVTLLGYELHDVVERTDLPAEEVAQLAPWSEIDGGITADSEAEARDIVDRIREDLEGQAAGEEP